LKKHLVLSVFPGMDLLGMAFELEGFCIVRGPDVIWGGDIRNFHPPAGVFHGVIGGPPCQAFSKIRYLNPNAGKRHGNLISEFCRVVAEVAPSWWIMENVPQAPAPEVEGYLVHSLLLDNRWLGEEQKRLRRFSFGTRDGRLLDVDIALFEAPLSEFAVTSKASSVPVRLNPSGIIKRSLRPPVAVLAGHGPIDRGKGTTPYPYRSISDICVLQGLPSDFLDESPFTIQGKRQLVGNGVPIPMGRAIARAVKKAVKLQ